MTKPKRSGRKIALFAGAGASKAFEFPLTGEIFPEIRQGLRRRNLFGRGGKAQRLHQELETFLDGVYPGLSVTSDADLPLITEVLSLVDHSLVSANAIGLSVQRRDLQRLRRLLERAIYIALDWDTDYKEQPKLLHSFVDSILRLRESGVHTGFISTNYDPVVEMCLFDRIRKAEIVESFDFGCEWRGDRYGGVLNRPLNPTMSIFKLHGSLNMLRCPHCDHVYINLDGDVSYLDYDGPGKPRRDGWNQCHCEYAPLEACMIAPSSVRDIRESNLLEIWRHSLEFLRRANDWIIMGYSFPPEDIGIRSMFCRAFQGRSNRPRVTIVQQGCDPKTLARYKIMFPDCRYECGGMEQFIKAFAADPNYIHSLPRIDRITPARFTL